MNKLFINVRNSLFYSLKNNIGYINFCIGNEIMNINI